MPLNINTPQQKSTSTGGVSENTDVTFTNISTTDTINASVVNASLITGISFENDHIVSSNSLVGNLSTLKEVDGLVVAHTYTVPNGISGKHKKIYSMKVNFSSSYNRLALFIKRTRNGIIETLASLGSIDKNGNAANINAIFGIGFASGDTIQKIYFPVYLDVLPGDVITLSLQTFTVTVKYGDISISSFELTD